MLTFPLELVSRVFEKYMELISLLKITQLKLFFWKEKCQDMFLSLRKIIQPLNVQICNS